MAPARQAQRRDLGRTLPELWRQGHLPPAQKKALGRRRMRRVMIRRPCAETLEATGVWISGAVSPLQGHPPVLRQADISHDDHVVERLLL